MRENPTLASNDFDRALAVLKREQAANAPSPRQERYFHLFNWVLYFFVGLGVIIGIGHAFDLPESVLLGFWCLEGLVVLSIFPLFFFNLGLVQKLGRQARLRQRLNLDKGLQSLFKAERMESRLSNLWTLLMSLSGLLRSV